MCAAYAHQGNLEGARAELTAARTLQGSRFDEGVAHIAGRFVAPEIRARFEATILAGLRSAGAPGK